MILIVCISLKLARFDCYSIASCRSNLNHLNLNAEKSNIIYNFFYRDGQPSFSQFQTQTKVNLLFKMPL